MPLEVFSGRIPSVKVVCSEQLLAFCCHIVVAVALCCDIVVAVAFCCDIVVFHRGVSSVFYFSNEFEI